MRVSIVIPTYNERENISRLLTVLNDEFKKNCHHSFDVVFVDGNSPDGTSKIIQDFSEENPNIHLMVEEKKSGLGSAYILGMKYSLANLKPDAVVEMDADFQHDPHDLGRFIQKLNEGYDYVLGSRYIKGGSIPKEWSLDRKFLSFFGNLFARLVLGVLSVHDITSGYRISRADKLSMVNLDNLDKRVYAYKIQLLYEMVKNKSRVSEIPIKFGLRDRGKSKMETSNIFGSFFLVIKLRIKDNASFFKFLVVGLAGLFVQTTLMIFLSFWGLLSPAKALLPSFLAAVLTTFSFNNAWSFKDRKIVDRNIKFRKFSVFLLVNVGGYAIQKSCILISQHVFNDSVALILLTGYPVGILLGLVWNYLFYSKIVWRG